MPQNARQVEALDVFYITNILKRTKTSFVPTTIPNITMGTQVHIAVTFFPVTCNRKEHLLVK